LDDNFCGDRGEKASKDKFPNRVGLLFRIFGLCLPFVGMSCRIFRPGIGREMGKRNEGKEGVSNVPLGRN
jgi:hypothetical protein